MTPALSAGVALVATLILTKLWLMKDNLSDATKFSCLFLNELVYRVSLWC